MDNCVHDILYYQECHSKYFLYFINDKIPISGMPEEVSSGFTVPDAKANT